MQDDVDIHWLYEMAETMKPLRISVFGRLSNFPTDYFNSVYIFPLLFLCMVIPQVLGDKIRAGPEDKSTLVTTPIPPTSSLHPTTEPF